MMPYQIYQLYQAERTKTVAEIRCADEQLGELSRAVSSAWQHITWPKGTLRALLATVAGSRPAPPGGAHGPARRPRRTRPRTPRRADYLAGYHPCFPAHRPIVIARPKGRQAGDLRPLRCGGG